MTVFLTPDGEPFFGGTYFPPEPRQGCRRSAQVLVGGRRGLPRAARRGRAAGASSSSSAASSAAREPRRRPSRSTESLLDEAVAAASAAASTRDWGGFGGAPKFPPASALELLLRMRRRRRRDARRRERTLDGMARGGMYDLVGGGFHRYSVDAHWLVPHFEKMLYDNALLVARYLHGWLVTGDERYRGWPSRRVDYMLRELPLPRAGSPRPRTPTPTASRA